MNVDSFAKVTKFVSKPELSFSVIDLSEVYKEHVKSVKRGFLLYENRRSVIIRDEITVSDTKQKEIYWFVTTGADVEQHKDHFLLKRNGKKMKLFWQTNAQKCEAGIMKAEPLPSSPNPEGQADNSAYRKIYIKIKITKNAFIQVKFTPNDGNMPNGSLEKLYDIT